jgi:anionic cell wall polymer biosynthesis LytR-Cps2A-Psr (LCP) family protein
MFASRPIVGRVVYSLACVLAAVTLITAGYIHRALSLVDETEKGITLPGTPTVTAGAMNILVMGLESRTNYYGQTLPESQLLETHSGNEQSVSDGEVGAQDTDTLILVHIFQGGQKAIGFSIPRDDLVTYPSPTYLGITEGKIDQAYDFAYNQSLGQTYGSSLSQDERYLKANQAGQSFEIATVEAVTGVHIDHFVEANLIGFYDLAAAFDGIEVCIKPAPAQGGFPAGANLTDHDVLTGTDNSGFNAYHDGYNAKKGGAQYLHLSSAQSLAYVRSRDTLPGVDVGRTKRQQAVIDFVVWKLKNDGAFSDFGTLNSLLDTASQYLITDSTFKLLTFATSMSALSGSHLAFQTLPFSSQVNDMPLNGSDQDVNLIDVAYLQQFVKSAFSAPPAATKKPKASRKATSIPAPAPSTVTVDVYNGSGVNGLAGNVSQALTALGYKAGAIANASAQSQTPDQGTQVFYGAGAAANAAEIAADVGATAVSLTSLPAGHVEVLLGSAVAAVPSGLASSQTSGGTASPSAASTSAGNNGATGGTLTVAPTARYGVPCVY